MSDRKATNKYYPPDWDPSKGSINKYQGQHPLRERARKLDQGILIVRFELPFNIWCESCGKHVGAGVRYNAEKKKVGNYYSTPILSFRMKCHLCSGWIEIQTDPKNSRYVVTSGARQKEETWDPEENETIKFKDEDEAKKLSENAIFKLEHDVEDKRKADESKTLLTRLQDLNDKLWEDQYTHNQRLRKTFREEKKFLAEKKRQADEICERNSLSIPLLEEAQEDIIGAKLTNFADPVLEEAKRRKLEVSASPLFSKTAPSEVKKTQSPLSKLGATLALNTKLKMDPFLRKEDKFKEESKPLKKAIVRIKKASLKGTDDSIVATVDSSSGNVLSALLNDYGDEESS